MVVCLSALALHQISDLYGVLPRLIGSNHPTTLISIREFIGRLINEKCESLKMWNIQ